MTAETKIDIGLLHLNDAHELAPLLASYVQSLKRGAPRRPDEFYAEQLLQDRMVRLLDQAAVAESHCQQVPEGIIWPLWIGDLRTGLPDVIGTSAHIRNHPDP